MGGKARNAGASLLALLLFGLAAPAPAGDTLRLTTTTSTESSGLLEKLLPPFEAARGIKVDVVAVGSGKALKLAENGDADVVLSHAPELEASFLEAGFGVNPRAVMYNDFVIVGPESDPAKVKGIARAADAMARIAAVKAAFVSRADESGTHQMERALWKASGLEPVGAWYLEAGQGMGEVLVMSSERQAYTLTDRGTLLAFRRKLDLEILVEGDEALFNRYTVIAVNPARHPHVKYDQAMALIAFLTGREGQKIIGEYRIGGQTLFHPMAIPAGPAPHPASGRPLPKGER